MPYERWRWADTGWLTLIVALGAVNLKGIDMSRSESFIVGIFAALSAFGWWRSREHRKEVWWEEYRLQRQREEKTL